MIREQTANQFACELHERLALKAAPERLMLGIVGYPGSGKTTASELIVDEFNRIAGSEQAIVVPMDGFHFSNEHLEELGLLAVKGVPETFDSFAFVSLLERLRRGESERAPRFDRSIEASIPDAITIGAEHRLLIIEGNYLLLKEPPWHKIRPLLDEAWFIDTSIEAIFLRLIERHIRGGRTVEGAKEKVASTDMPNAHLIDATKIFADRLITLRITGDEIMRGSVLRKEETIELPTDLS